MADAASPGGSEGIPPPTYYKFIGMALAVSSGIFIGSSFVLKKKGLLRSSAIAGEGHAYLKSKLWWTGMILMIVGEILNFVAYSFAPALLVTPLGALSVVVCSVLSSIVLKEKLNLPGKIGCALCIVGAVIIVLHAPAQAAVTDIDEFKHFVIQPGFLVYMSLVIVICLVIVWKVAPKYGKKHMLVYITICSLIGSLSVVATQGLGAAIVRNITTGTPQFNHWFIYVTMIFVVCTLITEINYLNKALNLFNTAMVTPVYYVIFTSATLVASVILFQGFSASPTSIMTVVMGFFVICAGVVLLQTSKRNDAAAAAMAAALKKSKSSLSLQDEESLIEDEKEDMVEPGPLGLRAVPFDSIRQMVRASTMPSTPYTVPQTPVAMIPIGEEDAHHQKPPRSIGRQLFAKFGRRGDAADDTTALTPSTPQQLRHLQDAGTPLQGVIIVPTTTATTPAYQGGEKQELRESEEFDEKQRETPYRIAGVVVPISAVPQLDDGREEERSPLNSNTLTLRD
ncbi:MAG: magnesium transporter NIPA-domain-containing protein [Linnemannia gamsii]|nr:MAG: magnesium transporter NIPA-domain-containing protein [Linnemannia gamsii]